ncbi:hypothetical protein [Streptomyces sp. NPDC127197]|uniref:hypothetical protein n=1 Tax=Streptomyces sp. NPDC127197 TaxID=3345388 RepID=UPI003638B60E
MTDVTRPTGGGAEGEPDRTGRRENLTGHEAAPATAREAGGTGGTARGAAPVPSPGPSGPADPAAPTARMAPLLPHDETDKLGLRMQQAVSGFVDGPRAAVEEADHVLEEIAARFTDAVTQRRRTLRRSWQSTDEGTPATTDTEQLRLALQDYRELAERLLRP